VAVAVEPEMMGAAALVAEVVGLVGKTTSQLLPDRAILWWWVQEVQHPPVIVAATEALGAIVTL
jgi:hypothetical protein